MKDRSPTKIPSLLTVPTQYTATVTTHPNIGFILNLNKDDKPLSKAVGLGADLYSTALYMDCCSDGGEWRECTATI